MEILMIQSRSHFTKPNISKVFDSIVSSTNVSPTKMRSSSSNKTKFTPLSTEYTTYSNTLLVDNNSTMWNSSDLLNITNTTDILTDYDYQMLNSTIPTTADSWESCKEWSSAQHSLFQTGNFFLAAAFLVPNRFKQSVLLFRALITIGYIFLTIWTGVDTCSPDLLLSHALLIILNLTHTCLLTWRFLPPTLSLELTELYLKMFKPLRVSKKHFKELVKEARIMNLENGDIYAVEDASPADERLSILLKGKLRVTCDDTHLHFINVHQFVDSPEWEANHEQSDDVFQVTVTAEEDSVYLCWSRMKLERFLRHRPLLKIVLDCIIGKDITYKLYSLNEHLSGLSAERSRTRRGELWAKTHNRSMSVDAVNTGTTGLVRSHAFSVAHKKQASISTESITPGKPSPNWIPFVANQFPVVSPFAHQQSADSATSLLRIPEQQTPQRMRSLRRNREVKFRN
ncbi:hypothetical protein RN001_007266 [Aquatica leii]|uniref:POPDC1-3 domain-containing protein n=1 Tax=Aquatica leii TaxID=1421715 RepID=A0AAN7SQV1_9COLE|nr:hypothetical protein RN001_007266 [Aquatica leii]